MSPTFEGKIKSQPSSDLQLEKAASKKLDPFVKSVHRTEVYRNVEKFIMFCKLFNNFFSKDGRWEPDWKNNIMLA